MTNARAFAPGNASCIFRICWNKNPAKAHSLGVGFTVDKGVIITARKSKKTEINFNNKRIGFPTVLSVIKKLVREPVEISIKSELPLGAGFGISGASALATALALGKLFKLKKSKKQLALVAHIAEVENRTGLGDVNGQFNGGFLIKTGKGYPLKAERLPIRDKYIYYKVFGKIETKKVLTDKSKEKKINKAAELALKKIKKIRNINLETIIEISKEFAVKSRLINRRLLKLTEDIEKNGGKASMIMLGDSIFSTIPFKGCKKIKISQNRAGLL